MSTATMSAPLALPAPSKASSAAPTTSPLDFAVEQILAKQAKQVILAQLSARYFLSGENALAVLNRAYAIKHAAFRKAGVQMVVRGIVMAFLGALITAIGYSMVKDSGGVYLVFYGLIFVGIVNIAKGLFRVVVG